MVREGNLYVIRDCIRQKNCFFSLNILENNWEIASPFATTAYIQVQDRSNAVMGTFYIENSQSFSSKI